MIVNKPRVHKSGAVRAWVWGNADRLFTAEEVNEAVSWSLPSTRSALNRMVAVYPQLERPQGGVYIWRSTARPAPAPAPTVSNGAAPASTGAAPRQPDDDNVILLTVLPQGTRTGDRIVLDEQGNLFVLKPLEI